MKVFFFMVCINAFRLRVNTFAAKAMDVPVAAEALEARQEAPQEKQEGWWRAGQEVDRQGRQDSCVWVLANKWDQGIYIYIHNIYVWLGFQALGVRQQL